ncbi:ShlB/FhaC/HecB family hemolysin secretion/activation protein [Azospirillum doebereinerae]
MPSRLPSFRAALALGAAILAIAPNTAAHAQDFERIAPDQPAVAPPLETLPPPPAKAPLPPGGKVLTPALRGLVFVGKAGDIRKAGLPPGGVRTDAGSLLDTQDFRAAMEPYLGRPVTLDLLNEIARLTVLYFREHDRPLVDVIVPEQNIASGTVQFLALEFVVGKVSAEGNAWFGDDLLLSGLRAEPGQPVVGSRLLEDINRLNENSFRHSDLVYQRGANPGESDIVLRTVDQLPLRVFAGVENTGSATTSRNRVFAGFNWGNAFGLDHRLSYQRTSSPDSALRPGHGRYEAHSFTYQIPLPWRDTLTFFGSYSESRLSLEAPFNQTGRSGQASARYTIRLPKVADVTSGLDVGFDFKRSNNDLEFGGTSVSQGTTDVLQWMIGYAGSRPDGLGRTALSANLFLSPGNWTGRNSDAAYRPSATWSGRNDAEARYAYLRVALERSTALPETFTWIARVQGQWSSANLLASEQLGAGGADSVRGYAEREVNGDRGVILSNELRAPEFSPSALLGAPGLGDSLQLLAFWDYGRVSERRSTPRQKSAHDLSSVGVGARYVLAPYLSAKLDVAHAMPKTGVERTNGQRVHFGLTLAY